MSATDRDAGRAVVHEAQLTLINAKWHLCQDRALIRLRARSGLACAPLFPEHPVIQVVAYDGVLLGRARLHREGTTARWIATGAPTAHAIGSYRTLRAAARALARAAGVPHLARRVRCLDGATEQGVREG
ncbi:hypothetical protein ABZ832_10045 [Streptantibioticus parmotrematis]|uniref:hypothetical protein n=1 Tax=Streptantibioticus parmotrematis TaxID=2873249 RepID=UPI0033E3A409